MNNTVIDVRLEMKAFIVSWRIRVVQSEIAQVIANHSNSACPPHTATENNKGFASFRLQLFHKFSRRLRAMDSVRTRRCSL